MLKRMWISGNSHSRLKLVKLLVRTVWYYPLNLETLPCNSVIPLLCVSGDALMCRHQETQTKNILLASVIISEN